LEFLTLIAFVCYYTIGAFLNLNFKNITIKKHGKKTIGVFKFGLNYKLQSLLINATIISTPYFSFLSCAYHNKNIVIYKIEFPFITELGIIIFAGFTTIELSIVAAATKHQRHCTKKSRVSNLQICTCSSCRFRWKCSVSMQSGGYYIL
jgi:hypothetical protein